MNNTYDWLSTTHMHTGTTGFCSPHVIYFYLSICSYFLHLCILNRTAKTTWLSWDCMYHHKHTHYFTLVVLPFSSVRQNYTWALPQLQRPEIGLMGWYIFTCAPFWKLRDVCDITSTFLLQLLQLLLFIKKEKKLFCRNFFPVSLAFPASINIKLIGNYHVVVDCKW